MESTRPSCQMNEPIFPRCPPHCPQLRNRKLHHFLIDHPQLVTNLSTLQRSLHSLISSHNVFVPSLLEVCTKIYEENVVPPVAEKFLLGQLRRNHGF